LSDRAYAERNPEAAQDGEETASAQAIADGGTPYDRWCFVSAKRQRDVDRTHPVWHGRNPEIAGCIEAY